MHVFTEHFWQAVVNSVVFAILCLVLISGGYVVLDQLLLRKVNFSDELKKNNIAVAIVIASYFLSMALVVYGVTN